MASPKVNIKVRSLSELTKYLKGYEDEFAQHMAELAADYMQNYINEKVYIEDAIGNGDSKYYNRTGDLLNAVTVKRNGIGSWEVKIDARHIIAKPREDMDMWGEHSGVDGSPQSRNMAQWIDTGNNSPLYSYEGIHYIEATNDYINNIVNEEWIKFATARNLI